MATQVETTGRLRRIGERRLGYKSYVWWVCEDCGTTYPELRGLISCNGHIISKCPWCRPDSEPWKYGRGS